MNLSKDRGFLTRACSKFCESRSADKALHAKIVGSIPTTSVMDVTPKGRAPDCPSDKKSRLSHSSAFQVFVFGLPARTGPTRKLDVAHSVRARLSKSRCSGFKSRHPNQSRLVHSGGPNFSPGVAYWRRIWPGTRGQWVRFPPLGLYGV